LGEDKIVDLTGFLRDIVNIKSLSGEEAEVAVRIRRECEELGYDEVFMSRGNVCAKRGSGSTVILYDAHMDVVEPGQGWRGEPFQARIEDGYMIGRGACDDKGSLAAVVYGGAAAPVDGVTLYVLSSVREEVAEGNGLKLFLEDTGIRPDYAVIAEPSSLRLAKGNRGRLGLRIDMPGIAAHASDPEAGRNAVYQACPVIEKIDKYNASLEEDSVAVTKVETSNTNINIIPERCSIYCDYRSAPGREEADIVDAISELADDGTVEVITPYYKPWLMDSELGIVRAGVRCLKDHLQKEEIIVWDFCTNGSYTAGDLGIPTVGFGPGSESEAHSAEEKIKLSDVEAAMDFFREFPAYIVQEESS
jgi:putative selenium metabolism hydrolase